MESGEKLVETGTPFKTDMEKMQKKIDEDNLKISNSSVEVFFKRFPFLENFVIKNSINKTSVSLIQESLLLQNINHHRSYWIILDENGKELTRVGNIVKERATWWNPWTERRSQNIGDALDYLKKKAQMQKAKFVLHVFEYYGHITLYMPPKGFTISEWLEEQVRIASVKLNEELERIDSEAK